MAKLNELFLAMNQAKKAYDVAQEAFAEASGYWFRSAVFGSARLGPVSQDYQDARWLSRFLAEQGIDVVTGGGPGIMEAAHVGANEGNQRSYSCSLKLPKEKSNGLAHLDFESEDFATRLQIFGILCCSYVCVAGGFGTDLERAWVAQHIQILKDMGGIHTHPGLYPKNPSVRLGFKPTLTLVGDPWKAVNGMLDHMERQKTINPEDRSIFRVVDTVREAAVLVLEDRVAWREQLAIHGAEPKN